jgi:hypothetical protein
MYSKIIKNRLKERKPNFFLSSKSFTLIEMIIVLAIIIGLVAILIAVLKPSKMLQGLRDTQRIADLKKIVDSITYYETENYGLLSFYGTPTLVYISLPDTDASCSSWLNQLPTLPIGYGYRCSATPTNIDGTGWIPINFSASSLVNLQKLPIDPINKPPYYYTYVVGGSYKLSAKPEKNYDAAIKDGGNDPLLYEAGSNKNLNTFQSNLVGYWSFDSITNSAPDQSGFNNNGTIYSSTTICTNYPNPPSGCPQWTDGKVNKALSFDGVDDRVGLPSSVRPTGAHSIEMWIYPFAWTGNNGLFGGKGLTSSYSNGIALTRYSGNNNLYYDIYSSSARYAITYPVPDAGKWTHLVATYDGNTMRLYYNGILQTQATKGSFTIDWSAIAYTMLGYSGLDYFNGLIDEVRIYNRALSADEIRALYQSAQ